MNRKSRIAVACFLVLTLVVTLGLGCGEDEEESKVTITIGHITDMTGPAGPAYRAVTFGLEDQVRNINENDLIPGVKIKIITWDTGYNPARDIPGYDWCRDRGAEVIYAGLPSAEVFKPFAARDKTPVVTLAVSKAMVDPPGWLFAMNAPVSYQVKAFLKWINENHWTGEDLPKIGSAGWEEPYHVEITSAIEEYCVDNPGQFEYVAGLVAPMGAPTWSGEVETLRDCDYVWLPSTGVDTIGFARDYRAKGGTATFIGGDAMDAFRGLLLDAVGWDGLDGSLTAHAATRWWGEPYPVVEEAERLLNKYHANEADDIIRAGIGYIGGFHQARGLLDMLQKTIEAVGAENFDGQAFYDTAIEFSANWDGYEQWEFTETKRYAWNYICIYTWSETADDVVRLEPDWVPNIVD